ncbi:hypothetical protein APSETT445_002906 [Aspergillus pseudonomiae]
MKQDDESHKMIASPHRDETLGHSDKESESQFPLKVRRSFRTRITDWYSGWRFTLALASFASVIVLAFNLSFVIWAAVHRKVEGNRGTLHEGNCEKVQHMSTGLHFAINILSTSLLGASNYCMAAVADYSVNPQSTDTHPRYNSTIFAITSANSYRVFIGPEGFDKLDVQNITLHDGDPASDVLLRLHAEAQNGTLQRLDISQCVNAYATDFQTSYGSLIVVTNDTDQAVQYHSVQHQATFMPVENLGAKASDPYQWICSSQRQAKDRTCGQLLSDVKDQVSKNNWYVDKSSTWTMGLGAVNAQTLITGTNWVTSLISNALIANTPQLLFSMIYFTFNAIFTAMTLAAEWSRYANHRKGLRVSGTPENAQRSSYFLSFPYRFAVPALAFSAILHWLISQSLFLVGIESYTEKLQRDPTRDVMTCGYSPPAMVSAIVVGTVMMAWLVGFSFRRLESGMPVAGSCSLAIAAACHPTLSLKGGEYVEEEGKWGAEQMKVQWGVTYVDSDGEGHCSFSSGEVGVPEDGKVYR